MLAAGGWVPPVDAQPRLGLAHPLPAGRGGGGEARGGAGDQPRLPGAGATSSCGIGEILAEALAACGFEEIRWCRRGESEIPLFRDLERHDTYGDTDELPHILIAEARKGVPRPERLEELRAAVQREFLDHMKD